MKHHDPAAWTDARPLVPRHGTTAADASPERIAAAVVAATGCDVALVCRAQGDSTRVIARAGLDANSAVRVDLGPPDEATLVLAGGTSGVPSLCVDGEPLACVSCAFPIAGEDGGLLILANRSGAVALALNPAQTYVVRAHAAHLATLSLLESLHTLAPLERELQRERIERLRLLESVAVHARDSIIITEAEPIDRPGPRILYCNAAFTKATGYEPEDVIGQTPRILQGARTTPESRARLRRALEAWEPIEIELINYRKDGSEFWVELSIVPVADESGWYTHWVSVQRDITERKATEDLTVRVRVAEVENEVLAAEIQERRRVEAELLYTAFHDNLTRLRNRAYFMNRLTDALHSSRDGAPCVVLFLDLDQFKVVNDSLGHLAGDTLLKEVARRIKGCARPQDTLARIGGDEFALLMEDTHDLAPAIASAEAILDAMRPPVRLARTDVFPSCSIGIVLSDGGEVAPEDLIRDADIAMYEAKRRGPGDFSVFTKAMHAGAVDVLALQTDLRRAVERDEFELAYQPIVRAADGGLVGFEALLRWRSPTRGLVAPDVFVPVAEELGLIGAIGRRVRAKACASLAAWQRATADPDLRMSVNVSASEFMGVGFLDELAAALREHGIQPATLDLEITESILLNPSPAIEGLLGDIRALGVRVSLDDFGTGYSSLRYINRYPIDAIKLDKSFVASMCSDVRTHAIVEAVVKLGATLRIDVVAEGIETAVQEQTMRAMGCPLAQGYWYARPLDEADVPGYLGRGGAAPMSRPPGRRAVAVGSPSAPRAAALPV